MNTEKIESSFSSSFCLSDFQIFHIKKRAIDKFKRIYCSTKKEFSYVNLNSIVFNNVFKIFVWKKQTICLLLHHFESFSSFTTSNTYLNICSSRKYADIWLRIIFLSFLIYYCQFWLECIFFCSSLLLKDVCLQVVQFLSLKITSTSFYSSRSSSTYFEIKAFTSDSSLNSGSFRSSFSNRA